MVSHISFERPVPDHAADLYRGYGAPEALAGWHEWNAAAHEQYLRDGFIVVRNALPHALWTAALQELRTMAGSDDAECSNVTYESSFREILERALGTPLDDSDAAARMAAIARIPADARAAHVRKFMGFTKTHRPLRDVSNYKPLRRVIEDIADEPTRLFQSMALVKPPRGREKPWHQDHAYFDLPLEARVCGVWIALGEVTEENGAMFMLRGGHANGPVVHFQRRDWQICDTEMAGARPVSLPMQAGDLVIFDAKIPHGTPINRTNQHRWALQFHYVGKSVERTAAEYRLSIFGADGKDVSC